MGIVDGSTTVAADLATASLEWFVRAATTRVLYGGGLPVPCSYGVPDCWPHVAEVLQHVGMTSCGTATEIILYSPVERAGEAAGASDVPISRSVGSPGTRFTATVGNTPVGCIEVIDNLTRGGTLLSLAGWSEIAELDSECSTVADALVAAASEWLRSAGTRHLLVAVDAEDERECAYLRRRNWQPLVRIDRGFVMQL